MSRFPDHIMQNLKKDKDYYSLHKMENIERCKVDEDYLGDVMIVNENLIWHSVYKYITKPEIIVKNYRIEKDDILQLGRLGFIKAIKAFDTTRGIKFSSFAVTAIAREIKCFLRDSANIIRPTRAANELMVKISKLENELGYLPSVEDLAIMLDATEAQITKALQIGKTVKYLDDPQISRQHGYGGFEDKTVTLLDLIEDTSVEVEQDVLDKLYTESVIEQIKSKLSPKELQVLNWRLQGYNKTQTANLENISQMRVSRIMKKVEEIVRKCTDLKAV